jgi:hypothetical protein
MAKLLSGDNARPAVGFHPGAPPARPTRKVGPAGAASYDFSMPTRERRKSRSPFTLEALRLQLEACRRAAELDGMVVSDEDGLLIAAAGDAEACDEIAARLPLIGQRTEEFHGVLLSAENGWKVQMRRFQVGTSELYLAAIGGEEQRRKRVFKRAVGGAARILAA